MADPTYYLDINGLSKHFGDPPEGVDEYNERNYGFGVTRETMDADNRLAKMLSAGYFKNSFKDPTYYAGAGLAKQYGNDYYARIGGMAGAMTGYDKSGQGKAVMPMAAGLLTLGKKDLGRLDFMYAPGVRDKDALLMMKLGIPIE
jgi:hypothetical protein